MPIFAGPTLASFDIVLTVSAMRYIRAIHYGRVNPKEFKLLAALDFRLFHPFLACFCKRSSAVILDNSCRWKVGHSEEGDLGSRRRVMKVAP